MLNLDPKAMLQISMVLHHLLISTDGSNDTFEQIHNHFKLSWREDGTVGAVEQLSHKKYLQSILDILIGLGLVGVVNGTKKKSTYEISLLGQIWLMQSDYFNTLLATAVHDIDI